MGFEFQVSGLRVWVQGSESRFLFLIFRVIDFGGFGLTVDGYRFPVQGFRFKVGGLEVNQEEPGAPVGSWGN